MTRAEARKRFFLEKEAKTFVNWGARWIQRAPQFSKVFWFFFPKKHCFLSPSTCRSDTSQSGFTLLEILIAVVVLGFVMAGLVQATRFGIGAWTLQTRLVDRATEMERVDRILRLVIEQAAPPLAADDKPFAGQEHRLEFITRLPAQPPTDPVRRAQVAIGVDTRHRLLLRWQPHPNAVALKTIPAPEEIVLAEGVDHFDVTYRQSVGDGGKWMRVWDDTPLPALVTMQIVLLNTHTHWPVIQASPMLDTNGSF